MALIVLGVAAAWLVLGGIVATVVLWNAAPAGARLAFIVLDASMVCFYGTIVALLYQSLGKQQRTKSERNPSSSHRQGHRPRPPDAQLKIARRIASELNTTLVRRRDGTCTMRLGPVDGRVAVHSGRIVREEHGPDWVEASTYSWLCMLADTLNAELIYDGSAMEWHLQWESVREAQWDEDDT